MVSASDRVTAATDSISIPTLRLASAILCRRLIRSAAMLRRFEPVSVSLAMTSVSPVACEAALSSRAVRSTSESVLSKFSARLL